LETLARESGWAFIAEETARETLMDKRKQVPPIVIYDSRVNHLEWSQTVRDIRSAPSCPCVILLCTTCDRNLWDELERAGGSDILHAPIDPEEARLTISRAWQLWRGLQQVRRPNGTLQ